MDVGILTISSLTYGRGVHLFWLNTFTLVGWAIPEKKTGGLRTYFYKSLLEFSDFLLYHWKF